MFSKKEIKYVINRKGIREPFKSSIINKRLENLADGITDFGNLKPLNIEILDIIVKVYKSISDGIRTAQLDEQACEYALSLYRVNPDYEKLAVRIAVSSHIRNIQAFTNSDSILAITQILHQHKILSPAISGLMIKYNDRLEKICRPINNFNLSYRGFFLMKNNSYLLSIPNFVIETPDYMLMRVAFAIVASVPCESETEQFLRTQFENYENNKFLFKHPEIKWKNSEISRELSDEDFVEIEEIYQLLSARVYTHATPTLFNAGFINPQLSSCFIFCVDDNLPAITDFWDGTARAQKHAGGIGFMPKLRCRGSRIAGTNGRSNGLVPFMRVVDQIGHYIDQGGGKRSGSISPQIHDWVGDIIETLKLRKSEDPNIARSQHKLFYGVFMSDELIRRFLQDRDWYFFCPTVASHLFDLHDQKFSEDLNSDEEFSEIDFAFTAAYVKLIREGKFMSKMPAREYVDFILSIIAEAGLPYIMSKDNINRNRAQNHVIYSSNLCTEITIPSNTKEIGVCNLASISIKKLFVLCESDKNSSGFHGDYYVSKKFNGEFETYLFDRKLLEKTVRTIVRSLNKIIDINFYPRVEMRNSNFKRRPIGIGISSLADALCKLRIPFESSDALELTAMVQEAIYYYAVDESAELAKKYGPHDEFNEYPASRGLLQPQLYAQNFKIKIPPKMDWPALCKKASAGLRNSVLIALMPTGNTSIIMGNSACFEPHISGFYRWTTLSVELLIVNKYLLRDAQEFGLNKKFFERFISLQGDISNIDFKFFTKRFSVEEELRFKNIYKKARDIDPNAIIEMAVARQPYVDQSQSMNLHMEKISTNTFNLHINGWRRGLKTLSYYCSATATTKEKSCENCVI